MSAELLARLEAEQSAGWAVVSPPPFKIPVIATAPRTRVDERHTRDAFIKSYARVAARAARGDLRTREHRSHMYAEAAAWRRQRSRNEIH